MVDGHSSSQTIEIYLACKTACQAPEQVILFLLHVYRKLPNVRKTDGKTQIFLHASG